MDEQRAPRRSGNLTDDQAKLLAEKAVAAAKETAEITTMLLKYIEAGGRDWKSFERICDHLARQGMHLLITGRGALTPEAGALARQQVQDAAGMTGAQGGMREHLHQTMAAAVLAAVYYTGQHHLVEPEDWPEETAATVLGAVRRAPGINQDPTMRNLRDPGRL